jgi:hypothetical protein
MVRQVEQVFVDGWQVRADHDLPFPRFAPHNERSHESAVVSCLVASALRPSSERGDSLTFARLYDSATTRRALELWLVGVEYELDRVPVVNGLGAVGVRLAHGLSQPSKSIHEPHARNVHQGEEPDIPVSRALLPHRPRPKWGPRPL